MRIGANMFGACKVFDGSMEDGFKKLKDAGFTSVEPLLMFSSATPADLGTMARIQSEMGNMRKGVWLDGEAEENIALAEKAGLTIISAHVFGADKPESLMAILPDLAALGKKCGIKYFIIGMMDSSKQGYEAMLSAFNRAAEVLGQDGMSIVLHNHEGECIPDENGTPLDYIMAQCPKMMLELDVGWADFAGADPVEIMQKYHDRLVLLHFKDICADAGPHNRNTCFTAVGEGRIPLKRIMEEAKNCPKLHSDGYIIDQDDSPGSMLDDLVTGIRNIAAAAS